MLYPWEGQGLFPYQDKKGAGYKQTCINQGKRKDKPVHPKCGYSSGMDRCEKAWAVLEGR